MIDTDDALYAARLHLHTGTMLSAEVVTEICKAYVALVDERRQIRIAIAALTARTTRQHPGYDANGSESP